MSYAPEPWDSVNLAFSSSPYAAEADPLTLSLDFANAGGGGAPFPWSAPVLCVEYLAPWSGANAAYRSSVIRISGADPADSESAAAWGLAGIADLQVRAKHADAHARDSIHSAAWGQASASYSDRSAPWSESAPRDRNLAGAWGQAVGSDRAGFVASWTMRAPTKDVERGFAWYSVNLTGKVYDDDAARYATLNTDTASTITLAGDSGTIEITDPENVALRFGFVAPTRPIVPHDVETSITARQASPHDSRHRAFWGAGQSVWHDYNLPYPVEPNPVDPPPDPADPPEIKTVYLIMNTLQITDVATGTPLQVQGVSIDLDIDSLSWKFSGTLYGQGSLALVAPSAGGMKDISVIINGHAWVFSIERYTSDEKFPTEKFTISGVSRTQYMAAPFAPTRSYSNSSATTAAQAANAELDNTGFALTWPAGGNLDLPDWPIPAGALSYRDKSPAQVIAQIVTAAGGIMVPGMAADSWTVQPRYKVLPWDWGTATPDAAIYIGMVRSRSAQYEPAPAFNACYVSGISQGVAVDVQRDGSGGTDPMPDIYDDLITDSQPAISRGKAELAGSGNKVVETLSVIIPENGAAPGILVPGMLVKVMHDDPQQDYLALVLAVQISAQKAGGAAIYQAVTLERNA